MKLQYIAWTSDEEVILFEINPKKVPVKVTYNKDWRENDSEEEKYLCEYVGDYEFKLRIDADGNINSLDNYLGNYDFQFEPKNVKDVKVLKTKITHPDVEYVYSEDGIEIYSDIDQVEPILLRDVGEYTVAFNLDERYYESVPFKVTILPKTIELKPNKQFKYFGEEDPVLENDDYILTREPGEDIGDYKLTVQSKSKNYKYEIIENDVFSILGRDVIHRNEKSGQLNGLFRVRMFRQDDSHNYITEEQISSEIKDIIEIAKNLYGIFGLEFKLTLSTRPDDYMGEIEVWNKAEADLKSVLDEICGENNYTVNEGDGAFYGPKIDIKMKDCLGREWQMGTVQLDFQLPMRFNISYIDKNGEKKTPILVHRAIFGSFERFIGILTEHYAGTFPLWLSPVQVKILSLSENEIEYANDIKKKLEKAGFRVEVDSSDEKIGYKIRQAQLEKLPYMIILGKNEVENNNISVRARNGEKIDGILLDEFISKLNKEVEEVLKK